MGIYSYKNLLSRVDIIFLTSLLERFSQQVRVIGHTFVSCSGFYLMALIESLPSLSLEICNNLFGVLLCFEDPTSSYLISSSHFRLLVSNRKETLCERLQVQGNISIQSCNSATMFKLSPPGQMPPVYINILEKGHYPYRTIH